MGESLTIVLDSNELVASVCGVNDINLKVMEENLGGRISARGNEVRLEGAGEIEVKRFKSIIDKMVSHAKKGEEPSPEYLETLVVSDGGPAGDPAGSPAGGRADNDTAVRIPHGFRWVFPRGKGQTGYIQGMRDCDISFCIGPAGTGKTYLAVAEALRLVLSKKMRKMVLTRPVVEAGENLGFLPGDLAQKIHPYLRPLYDSMESLVPYEIIHRLEETRAIEIAPLAYMRGRSLNDCIVILDEAQNTTKEQMKMFLTRIGTGARAVITGDATQIDLPKKTESGLLHAMQILKNIDGIHFTYLHTVDVVRNPIIKKIIQAYDENNS